MLPKIISLRGDNRPYLKVDVMGFRFYGLLDSGASCTILGKGGLDLIEKLELVGVPSNFAARTADGTVHVAACEVDISYRVKNKVQVISTLVIPSLTSELILGMDFWAAFNIKPTFPKYQCATMDEVGKMTISNDRIELSESQSKRLGTVMSQYLVSTDEFIGCSNMVTHKIETGDAKPVVKRPYPVSPFIQKSIDAELDRMIKMDVIESSNSDWANPIVTVKKPDGRIRLCLDARGLNEATIKDRYPLPHIGRILQQIRASKFLSSLDLKDAFWQIALEDSSKAKTAFNVPGRGHFQFKRLPFGLCNSAQTLCKALDKAIGNDLEPNVFVYIDDIIVISDTFEHHLELLSEIAKRLKNAGFSISMGKSKFCVKQLRYLGYVLDEYGLGMDPDKITPILNIPTPKNLKELRRIMGMASWYRRFIRNFSEITGPMTNLLSTKKFKKFEWTKEADDAFKQLKTALVSAPVLCTPDYDKPFTIQTDASDTGVGAVLTQGDGENERVVAYFSAKLTAAQQKYSTTERECLGVLEGIRKFRSYIEGSKFRVITDHASLVWLRNLKDPTSRLARWAIKLQEFDFDLVHRKGKLNVIADALSRSVELIDIDIDSENIDPEYKQLRDKISKNQVKFPKFLVKGGKIFKNCRSKGDCGLEENGWKFYVPRSFRDKILFENHDSPLGAHLGVNKTLKKLQIEYYWPKMEIDVKKYVKTCEHCQVGKHPNQSTRVPIGLQKVVDGPWDSISVDFLGPFPRSKRQNKYLFVVVDNFSKWCLLKPMRQADSKSVINFLENEVFLVYGVPSKIICDNGSQFASKSFRDMMSEYRILPQYNAVYHPQHNPAERINRVILSSIRAYMKNDQTNWDLEISKIACAMRTSVHDSIGFSPFMVNFGRNMALQGSKIPITDQQLSAEGKMRKMDEIRDIVGKNLSKAYDKYSKSYNLRTRPLNFSPGEIVLRKSYLQSSAVDNFNAKLAQQYLKCRVKEKIGNVTYLIEELNGKIIGKYHANDLRKFYDRV